MIDAQPGNTLSSEAALRACSCPCHSLPVRLSLWFSNLSCHRRSTERSRLFMWVRLAYRWALSDLQTPPPPHHSIDATPFIPIVVAAAHLIRLHSSSFPRLTPLRITTWVNLPGFTHLTTPPGCDSCFACLARLATLPNFIPPPDCSVDLVNSSWSASVILKRTSAIVSK